MTSISRPQQLAQMADSDICDLYTRLGGAMPHWFTRNEMISSILCAEAEIQVAEAGIQVGCPRCRQMGEWCGFGTVIIRRVPCVCCGTPTKLRSACGAARDGWCFGGPDHKQAEAQAAQAAQAAPAPPAPPSGTARAPRAARAPREPRPNYRRLRQQVTTESAVEGLDEGAPMRLLGALEGPFAPVRMITTETGRRRVGPYWHPDLPGITFATHIVTGYHWSRPYTGRVTVLDRSGAWVAATSSVVVAHGALEHTGAIEFTGRPGYYQMATYPWHEFDGLPHPLGHVGKRHETVWLPAPTVSLLRDLVTAGRWPDIDVLDSYTGDGVRLTDWSGHVNKLRRHAITTYGRDDGPYDDVKSNFGQAMSLMLGHLEGVRRTWKCKAARPDWTHHIQAQASATLWRWADDCRTVVPAMPPVALRNVDELLVPEPAVKILTTTERPKGKKPLALDPDGIALGTFKIKGTEEWTA